MAENGKRGRSQVWSNSIWMWGRMSSRSVPGDTDSSGRRGGDVYEGDGRASWGVSILLEQI